MSLIQESFLNNLLNECEINQSRPEKEAQEAVLHRLSEIYEVLKKNIRETFSSFSLDIIVRFTEISVEVIRVQN